MQSIEEAINKLVWQEDNGLESKTQMVVALLIAMRCIVEQLANINSNLQRIKGIKGK